MSDQFNWEAAAAQLRSVEHNHTGPKLSFFDKCSAFAAILAGSSVTTVSKAFGISRSAVNYLASCKSTESADKSRRYKEVMRECERLGDRKFMETYFTEEVHNRCHRIAVQREQTGDDRRERGPSKQANKYEWLLYGITETDGGDIFRIDWIEAGEDTGWYFVNCQDRLGARQEPKEHNRYKGMECLESPGDSNARRIPFKTSSAAYHGIKKFVGEEK